MKNRNKNSQIILCAAIVGYLLSISSCKVAQKEYKRPTDLITDSLFRNKYSTDTTTMATMSWKELFKDPKLQTLIQKGIDNNLDLKIAIARISSAQADYKQSKLGLLPTISATVSAKDSKLSTAQGGGYLPTTAYTAEATAEWEADIWGKLTATKRANLDALLQEHAYQREVQTQVVANIATYYYELMSYDKQLGITNQTIENYKQDVKLTTSLMAHSTGTGADVEASKSNLHSAELTKVTLEQDIVEAENALCVILAIPSQHIERSAIIDEPILTELKVGVPVQLLANRPDVQEAEFQLRYYAEMQNVARAYFYPSFTITATGGWSSTTAAKLFDASSIVGSILGSLTQPIFQQGANKQRLAVANANYAEYEATFKKTLLSSGEEISNELVSYEKGVELESKRKEQILSLTQTVAYTKKLMQYSSSVSYIDVLTASQNLLSAQLSYVGDKLQQAQSIIAIYKGLGGGWK